MEPPGLWFQFQGRVRSLIHLCTRVSSFCQHQAAALQKVAARGYGVSDAFTLEWAKRCFKKAKLCPRELTLTPQVPTI